MSAHEKAIHHVLGTVPVAPIARLREVAEQVVAAYLSALTADGPVILLPDEGEGVRVARLEAAVDAWATGSRYASLADAARETSS